MKNFVHFWASLKLSMEALLPLIIFGTPVIRLSCTVDLATLKNLATSIDLARAVPKFKDATISYPVF